MGQDEERATEVLLTSSEAKRNSKKRKGRVTGRTEAVSKNHRTTAGEGLQGYTRNPSDPSGMSVQMDGRS